MCNNKMVHDHIYSYFVHLNTQLNIIQAPYNISLVLTFIDGDTKYIHRQLKVGG